MDIKEIREKARLTDDEIMEATRVGKSRADGSYDAEGYLTGRIQVADAQITKYNNTEIVPERGCEKCSCYVATHPLCPECNSTGLIPPITVEQAIKKAQHDKVMK